jgi:ArsR family metal-binding transcriptional regulator
MKLKEGTVKLSEHVRKFLKDKTEKEEKIRDLSQAKPVEITEIRKLMPCTADPSMSRIIANMTPPLGGVLKILEPLFPRSRYLDKKRSLMIQKEESIITIYASGKVIVGMAKNEVQAKEILEELKIAINEAIKKRVAPCPGEKIRAKFTEIYRYLPQTNCGNCNEKDCYSFAVRLTAGETTLDRCILLKEAKYTANQEHLQVLTAYI